MLAMASFLLLLVQPPPTPLPTRSRPSQVGQRPPLTARPLPGDQTRQEQAPTPGAESAAPPGAILALPRIGRHLAGLHPLLRAAALSRKADVVHAPLHRA